MLRKATNLALFVYDAACLVMVLLGTPKPPYSCDSCMRMSTHKVLLVPRLVVVAGALLQEGVGDLVVDVLLLNHVVVGKLYMAVQILQPGRLAKPYELVADEAILDVLKFVDVLHNCLTLILYKVLDKSISVDENTKTNVAVNYKGRGREQGTEVREGGVGGKQELCCMSISAEIPLTRSLFFLKLRSRPASSLNTCLISERTSRATLSFALMPSSAMHSGTHQARGRLGGAIAVVMGNMLGSGETGRRCMFISRGGATRGLTGVQCGKRRMPPRWHQK